MAKKSKRSRKHVASVKTKNPDKINPFEVRLNKQKHDVLGRKTKQDRGLPGIARNKAIKKRETTILQEYLSKNKSSKFVDKRIGENDLLNREEKIMARFSRETKKRFQKSRVFNLNEDEELTHLGRTIGDIDKFDQPDSASDEEGDRGKLSGDFVKSVHFGGFEERSEVKMTHKERMDEIISESKKKKYERKVENEANVDLTEKLDAEWKSVASLLSKKKNYKKPEELIDDYDIKVRQLKFEAKGQPSDRLKTAEEVAAEESEKLRRMEEERVKRMTGDASRKGDNSKHVSADDLLCDGFAIDELDDNQTNLSEEKDEESGEVEQSEDSDSYSDVLSDKEESDDEKKPNSVSRASKKKDAEKVDLPYVFPVPSTVDEFLEMVSGRSANEQTVIVDRIIKCNHPSRETGSGNRKKLETFFVILLQYIHDIGSDLESDSKLLGILEPHFLTLLRLSKKAISESFLDVLKEMQEKFQKGLKRNSGKTFPDLGTLYLFKIISVLYPTSDFRHPIVTPAMIFMSQLLTKCRTNSLTEVASCIFLCEMFFDYVSLSKRFVPEVIKSLYGLLDFASKSNSNSATTTSTVESLDLIDLICSKEAKIDETFKARILSRVACVTTKFAKLYEELPSFSEAFAPVLQLCECLSSGDFYPEHTKRDIEILLEVLRRTRTKPGLARERKKPKPLKQYEPRFQTVFTGKKERIGGREKLERQKLTHKYKRELKGAMREIRQDNQFLANRFLAEQLQKDKDRKRKVKEIYAELANQEGDFKKMKNSKLISM